MRRGDMRNSRQAGRMTEQQKQDRIRERAILVASFVCVPAILKLIYANDWYNAAYVTMAYLAFILTWETSKPNDNGNVPPG